MKNIPGFFCLIAATIFCFTACSTGENKNASPENPPAATEEKVPDAGQVLFEQKCIACHGADGTAGIGGAANLQVSRLDSISLLQTITNGRNGMPAFKDQLDSAELKQVIKYVKGLRN
jgi:mono/diheme cytochrome c family protein